jgi:hypothetical protein
MANSTIVRKKKRCVTCFGYDYIFSKGRCKHCATIEDTQKRIDKVQDTDESESMQNLIADLDYVFSQYIRVKHADKDGIVTCFTSGKKYNWQQIQCGHFISRKNLSTRWLEANCRPQSEHDNCLLSGNLEVFEKKLEEEKKGSAEYLRELSREINKPTISELKELIIEYRSKLNQAKKKFLQG